MLVFVKADVVFLGPAFVFFGGGGGRGNAKGAFGPTCFLESWVFSCLAPSGEPESSNLSVASTRGVRKVKQKCP